MLSKKQKIKLQKGGVDVAGAAIKSGEVIGKIVLKVFGVLWHIIKYLFAICPNPDGDWRDPSTCFVGNPKDWHLAFKEKHPKAVTFNLFTGPAWRFIIMSVKITLFIALFCLGGPIVLLGGLIFLYVQVFNQIDTRIDDPTKTISELD